MGIVVALNEAGARHLADITMRPALNEIDRQWEILHIQDTDPDATIPEEDAMNFLSSELTDDLLFAFDEDAFFGEEDDISFLDQYAVRMYGD